MRLNLNRHPGRCGLVTMTSRCLCLSIGICISHTRPRRALSHVYLLALPSLSLSLSLCHPALVVDMADFTAIKLRYANPNLRSNPNLCPNLLALVEASEATVEGTEVTVEATVEDLLPRHPTAWVTVEASVAVMASRCLLASAVASEDLAVVTRRVLR